MKVSNGNAIARAYAAVALSMAFLCVGAFFSSAAIAADDPSGTWRDNERGSVLRVFSCGGGMCAQIVKTKEAGAKDVNNPDASLKNRPLAGLTIMSGAKKKGDNVWKGSIYNAEDGKRYSGSMTLVSESELQLEGCAMSIFCQSRTWSRVK